MSEEYDYNGDEGDENPEEKIGKNRAERKITDRKITDRKITEKQINVIIESLERVFRRDRKSKDMNFRCYTLLDRLILAMDIATASVEMTNLSGLAKQKIKSRVTDIQEEITEIMNWVISYPENNTTDLVNPIPPSENVSEEDIY